MLTLITELGQVYTWGSCEYGQLGMASELLSISSRSTSPYKNRSTTSMLGYQIFCLFMNNSLSLDYMSTPFLVKEALLHERIVTGSCGSYHSVVVTIDGKLFSWGLGDKGQLGKVLDALVDRFNNSNAGCGRVRSSTISLSCTIKRHWRE